MLRDAFARSSSFCAPGPRAAVPALALLLAALLAVACGGGGGGGGSDGSGNGGNPTPTPGAQPTPQPSPSPEPTLNPGQARLLLAENDSVAGLEIVDIEDAALSTRGDVAAIITVRGAGNARAVLRGDTQGTFAPLLEPGDPLPGADLITLGRVRLGENGDLIFESGEGLDTDRLYYAPRGGGVVPIAGADPGPSFPTFRILGDSAIGAGGIVGFVAGGDDCEVTMTDESTRTICDGHLFVAENGVVTEVEDEGVDLAAVSPTRAQVATTGSGVVYFSVPGGGQELTLLRYAQGEITPILAANDELDEIGRLIRPQVTAANAAEDLLLTTTLASDEGPSRPTVLGILSGGDTFTVLARERVPVGDGLQIVDLRGVGIDDEGRVLYIERVGEEGQTDAPISLVVADGLSRVEVATEGRTLPGTDKTVISIEAQRINSRGDVAFLAELGRIEGLTTIIEEVRAVVRLADGTYLAPVSSASPGSVGTLSSLEIAGFDAEANLLIVGTRDPSQTVLVYAPSGR